MLTLLDHPAECSSECKTGPHVLLVLDQFPKVLGGGERIVLRLARLLPCYGYRVSILTFLVHPESAFLKESSPCPVYVLPIDRTYDLRALRAAFALRRFIVDQNVSLVQTFFESSDLFAGAAVKALTRARLIWSRRDMGILRGRKHRVAYRLFAGLPDAVFAVSDEVRKHSIETDGIPAVRVRTIYNGLDLKDSPPEVADAVPQVITLGNIRHVKGHDVLIQAAAMVIQRFPGTLFSIMGEVLEPEYFAELKTMIKDLGLEGRVIFLGGIADPSEYLGAGSLFVLPSRSEGFSNAVIEAMAASMAIVATDVGGNAEAIKHGISGLIVPSEDPEALAEAMCFLLADPARARMMGLQAHKRARERFSTDTMMKNVTSAYRELLGEDNMAEDATGVPGLNCASG